MKTKIYIIAIATSFITCFSACKKDIKEINKTNPNQFGDSDPALMITGAQMANVLIQEGELARLTGIFSGQFTGYDRQFVAYNTYDMTAGDFDNIWGSTYAEGIAQCRLVQDKAKALNNKVLEGVGLITEVNLMLTAAAMWGDVPNTEAANPAFSKPKFDKMSDVYNSCIAKLDAAIALVGSSNKYAAAYSGTFNWGEVANTLKARALLHKKDYAGAIAAADLGIKQGNDLYANHSNATPGAWNLYYDFLDWNRAGYISCAGSFLHHMLDSGDAKYRGNAKTDERNRYDHYYLEDQYTPVDPNWDNGIFAATSNFKIVSYAENELILAECYQRTNDNTKALEHLNNVRAENEAEFGGFDEYLIVDFGPGAMVPGASISEALLKEILTEKYVSLFGQIEPFNDVRRTNNLIGVSPNKGTELPARLLYPQSEVNSNPNTPKGFTLFSKVELFQ